MTQDQPQEQPPEQQFDRTGDESVDAALTALEQLAPEAPLTEHVATLTAVQDALHRRLTATES